MKAAEEIVVKLRDKEVWTRIDVLIQAEMIYNKLGEKEKARLHHQFVEGYLMTIIVAGRGQSIEKPFEVLYVDEEYLVLRLLDETRDKQALMKSGDHFFDVLTVKAKPAESRSPGGCGSRTWGPTSDLSAPVTSRARSSSCRSTSRRSSRGET